MAWTMCKIKHPQEPDPLENTRWSHAAGARVASPLSVLCAGLGLEGSKVNLLSDII